MVFRLFLEHGQTDLGQLITILRQLGICYNVQKQLTAQTECFSRLALAWLKKEHTIGICFLFTAERHQNIAFLMSVQYFTNSLSKNIAKFIAYKKMSLQIQTE